MLSVKPPSPPTCLLPPGLHSGRVNGLSSHQYPLSRAAASSPSLNQSPISIYFPFEKHTKKPYPLISPVLFFVFVVYAFAIFSLYHCRRALKALEGHDKVISYHQSTVSFGMHCRLYLLYQWAGQGVSFQSSPASACLRADLAVASRPGEDKRGCMEESGES
ncbi:hypothetical protein AAY473_015090 [Plecturocebus cupreus]